MDQAYIERYRADADAPRQAIKGLSREDLVAYPVPGTWSIQEIVLHLCDSDLIAADRMKRVIAEDNPTIIGYNETLFGQRLFYQELDTELACELFRLNRLLMASILERLPKEAFARQGEHNETGTVTLEYLVKTYVNHVEHHLKFIRQKRELLGKPGA